jgi:hypothetical protein
MEQGYAEWSASVSALKMSRSLIANSWCATAKAKRFGSPRFPITCGAAQTTYGEVKVLHEQDLAEGFGEVYLPLCLNGNTPMRAMTGVTVRLSRLQTLDLPVQR